MHDFPGEAEKVGAVYDKLRQHYEEMIVSIAGGVSGTKITGATGSDRTVRFCGREYRFALDFLPKADSDSGTLSIKPVGPDGRPGQALFSVLLFATGRMVVKDESARLPGEMRKGSYITTVGVAHEFSLASVFWLMMLEVIDRQASEGAVAFVV